jgi:hypothetical protein
MKAGDVFPSKYLKSEDLSEKDMTLTVKDIKLEEIEQSGGKKVNKAVAYFLETEKALIINKTNWNKIVKETGQEDSDGWIGKQIVLTIIETDFKGEMVSAIRVREVKG